MSEPTFQALYARLGERGLVELTATIGYYAMLGLGFILVEIPMLQKMSIYMGSPTLALVGILFSLLLFSGVGSFLSQRVPLPRLVNSLRVGLVVLIALVVGYALVLPSILYATQGLGIELKNVR